MAAPCDRRNIESGSCVLVTEKLQKDYLDEKENMNTISPPEPASRSGEIEFRQGTISDSYASFKIFEQTLADLVSRMGSTTATSASSPSALARMWQQRRPLYEHLAETADAFWVARQNGQEIGFSRAVLRDGVQQLTELFVLPGTQSKGVGRELIHRAFPNKDTRYRSIIATADFRAQALYLKSGVYPRFPIYYFGRKPEARRWQSDLFFASVSSASPETLDTLAKLDREILDFRRDIDHSWLLRERQGYLYYRDGRAVGYGYVGERNGPFALLNGGDFPAVLAHAETRAAEKGHDEFGVEVPMVNQTAVDFLLGQGFQLDSFMAVLMSDKPFGKFEQYICSSPPFFM